MKEKLMTQEGLVRYRVNDSYYQNALNLMVINLWEDALACMVLDVAQEKVLASALQLVNEQPLSESARRCADNISMWLRTHDDALRRSIFQQAEALGFDTPLGALGLALFWMQGSMTPEEFEAVYPAPHLAPLMLHCALKQLAVQLTADNPGVTGTQKLLAQWQCIQGGQR